MLSTDYLRQRALYAVQDLVSKTLSDSPETKVNNFCYCYLASRAEKWQKPATRLFRSDLIVHILQPKTSSLLQEADATPSESLLTSDEETDSRVHFCALLLFARYERYTRLTEYIRLFSFLLWVDLKND